MRLNFVLTALLVAACAAGPDRPPPQQISQASIASTSRLSASERRILRDLLESDIPHASIPLRNYSKYLLAAEAPGSHLPILSSLANGKQKLLWDPNKHLSEFPNAELGVIRFSPDFSALGFSVDLFHDGHYRAFVASPLDAKPKELSPDDADVHDMHWLDLTTTCYILRHGLRPDELRCSSISSPASTSILWRENDPAFSLSLSASAPPAPLLLRSASSETSQLWRVDSIDGNPILKVIRPRVPGRNERGLAWENHIAILSRDSAGAQRVTIIGGTPKWHDYVAPADIEIRSLAATKNGLLALESRRGLPQLKLLQLDGTGVLLPVLPEGPFQSLEVLPEPGTLSDSVLLKASSPNLPQRTFKVQIMPDNRVRASLVQAPQPLPTKLSYAQFNCSSTDGALIPLSILSSQQSKQPRPTVLYAYGAYGAVSGTNFEAAHLPLLERGFGIAYAQVRGSGYLGAAWWEAGRGSSKLNTFDDYLACADFLRKSGLASSLVGRGRSAGGLTVASAALRRPDLFDAIVLDKPFLNVIDFVLSPAAPLRDVELSEWGNPSIPSQRENILAYSPFPFPPGRRLPATLLLTSLNDEVIPAQVALDWAEQAAANGNDVSVRVSPLSTHQSSVDTIELLGSEAIMQNYIIERAAR